MKSETNSSLLNNDSKNSLGLQIPRNVKIPFLSYEEGGSNLNSPENEGKPNKIPIFDLNKLFEINFSYNFEILKSLIETLILNQQENRKEYIKMKKDFEIKINDIENNIIDLKIKVSNPQSLEELKKEKEKILEESEKIRKKIIREKNLELKEEKESKNVIINNLSVSIKLYIY